MFDIVLSVIDRPIDFQKVIICREGEKSIFRWNAETTFWGRTRFWEGDLCKKQQ
jgi:hypothetical protein